MNNLLIALATIAAEPTAEDRHEVRQLLALYRGYSDLGKAGVKQVHTIELRLRDFLCRRGYQFK